MDGHATSSARRADAVVGVTVTGKDGTAVPGLGLHHGVFGQETQDEVVQWVEDTLVAANEGKLRGSTYRKNTTNAFVTRKQSRDVLQVRASCTIMPHVLHKPWIHGVQWPTQPGDSVPSGAVGWHVRRARSTERQGGHCGST